MTKRQQQIFDLICQGMTSKEIGIELGRNYRTIQNDVGEMLAEYDCKNTPQLVYKIMSRPKLFRMTAGEKQQYCEREYKMSEIM